MTFDVESGEPDEIDLHENDSRDEDDEKMRQQLKAKLEVRVGADA